MDYRVREIDSFDAFRSMGDAWNALLEASPLNLPFLTHEWLCLWWRHFGGKNRLAVMVVERAGQLAFAVPLMEVRTARWGVPVVALKSMTNDHSCRFTPVVRVGEEDAAGHLWRYLRDRPRRWHWVEMAQVPSDAPAWAAVADAARAGGGRVEAWQGERSPYLPVAGTWEDHWASLKSGFRRGKRNQRKRIEKIGPMAYETIADPTEVDAALEEGLGIEAHSWKGEAGTAILCDPVLAAFYRDWARAAADNGWLRLCFLTIGGRRVAFEYALEYGGVRYSLKNGYDPEFSALSVGQFLAGENLKGTFERGLKAYEFLGRWTTAKGDWKPLHHTHLFVYLYNRGPVAAIARLYKFRLKAAVARRIRRG